MRSIFMFLLGLIIGAIITGVTYKQRMTNLDYHAKYCPYCPYGVTHVD